MFISQYPLGDYAVCAAHLHVMWCDGEMPSRKKKTNLTTTVYAYLNKLRNDFGVK